MAENKGKIDTSLISELANLLTDTDLTEIEVEQDNLRIRVSRNVTVQQVAVAAAPSAPAPAPAPIGGVDSSDDDASYASFASSANMVPSPMVGTAYMAAAPGAEPYVKVGDSVSQGDTIMIVEAMKTMNQIPSPRSGKVTAILVEDGTPVEFGEPLMVIE